MVIAYRLLSSARSSKNVTLPVTRVVYSMAIRLPSAGRLRGVDELQDAVVEKAERHIACLLHQIDQVERLQVQLPLCDELRWRGCAGRAVNPCDATADVVGGRQSRRRATR